MTTCCSIPTTPAEETPTAKTPSAEGLTRMPRSLAVRMFMSLIRACSRPRQGSIRRGRSWLCHTACHHTWQIHCDAFGRQFLARDQLDVNRSVSELAIDAKAKPELVGVVINNLSFVNCNILPFILAGQLLSYRLESFLFRHKNHPALFPTLRDPICPGRRPPHMWFAETASAFDQGLWPGAPLRKAE